MFKSIVLMAGLLGIASAGLAQPPDDFYPLALGNYWEYETWDIPCCGPYFHFHQIVGDTVMPNGHRYWINHLRALNYWSWDSYTYERVSEDHEFLVYRPHQGYPNDEVLKYKLDPEPGQVWFSPYWGTYWRLDSLYQATLFDTLWKAMELSFSFDSTWNMWWGHGLINGLGPDSEPGMVSCNSITFIRGAIIDGVQYGSITSVEGSTGAGEVPREFELAQNFPNPFNAETVICYRLPARSSVVSQHSTVSTVLRVYNIAGQVVRTLVDESQKWGKSYEIVWDGRDDGGGEMASGVYLYRLQAGGYEMARRMVMLR